MKANNLKAKLKMGAPVLGTWSIINSAMVSEILASSGLDFQILDMEHGVFDTGTVAASIRASESRGCSPLVRMPGLSAATVQKCLDMGAHGIIFPQIKSRGEAEEAVRSTLYGPEGERGFNPFTRAGNYSGRITEATPKLKNGFALTSVIIENQSAYKELEAILEIPALDMIYLGVYDMSVALGCPGEMSNPLITSFLAEALPRIRRAGKAAGVMVKNKAEMSRYIDMGANFLVYGVDSFVIRQSFENAVADLKDLAKTLS